MRAYGGAPGRVATRKQLEELLGPLTDGMAIVVEVTPPDWNCRVYRGECSCCGEWAPRPFLARLQTSYNGVVSHGKALPCCSEDCANALAVATAVERG